MDEGVSLRDGRAGRRGAPTARAPANFVTRASRGRPGGGVDVLPLNFVCSLRALALLLLLQEMCLFVLLRARRARFSRALAFGGYQ